jgi:hypothetical protein
VRTLVLALALGACDAAPSDLAAPAVDPALAQRSLVDRLDALEARNAALAKQLADAQATVATLSRQVAALDERTGPGRQGGHLAVLEDYAVKLAGGSPVGPDAPPEKLAAQLVDAGGPRVDGAGLALAARLRKRPEMLFQAWDDVIDEALTQLASNPATGFGHFVDDWQGEVAYLKVEDRLLWTQSHDQRAELDGQLAVLGEQLTRRQGDLCLLGGLVRAQHAGDEEGWLSLDDDLDAAQDTYCGKTDHL